MGDTEAPGRSGTGSGWGAYRPGSASLLFAKHLWPLDRSYEHRKPLAGGAPEVLRPRRRHAERHRDVAIVVGRVTAPYGGKRRLMP